MTTGQLIKAARKEAGMTQAELASKLGIPYQSVSQWERDTRNPKYDTLQRIAAALGVHPGKLMGLTDYGNNTWGPEGLPGGELDDIQQRTLAIKENQKALNRLKERMAKKEHVIGKLELLNDDGLDTIVQVIDAIVGNPRLSTYPSSPPYFQQSQPGAAIEAHSPQSDESDTTK